MRARQKNGLKFSSRYENGTKVLSLMAKSESPHHGHQNCKQMLPWEVLINSPSMVVGVIIK